MIYDKDVLRTLTEFTLKVAKENLVRHGNVAPHALVYDGSGTTRILAFEFEGLEEKRALQAAFRRLLTDGKTRAAIVVQESWMMFPLEGPVDLTRSLADQPGRKEAIVVEARSSLAHICFIQRFIKGPEGVTFGRRMDLAPPFTISSEWFGTIWQQG